MNLYDFYTEILRIQNQKILKELVENSKYEHLKKGTKIVREDEEVSDTYFLVKGVIRGYFTDDKGKEITDCFCTRCGSPTVVRCDSKMVPAVALDTLTECEIISVPISKIEELQYKYMEVSVLYNQLLLKSFAEHWEAKTTLYRYSAMERYKWFLKKYPGLIDQVCNKYIASYLNITPVTLSRLRSELNKQCNDNKY
ncbi:MAG: Crp/Fnr family transcriptional regulator [Clostridia bacterium]|nr:Crp/Fnr family transcriptional regulator [Clostridia bacterium]